MNREKENVRKGAGMETKMNDYKAWADEVIGKIREKMDWVSQTVSGAA